MVAFPCCSGDFEPVAGSPPAPHDRSCPFRAEDPPLRRPAAAPAPARRPGRPAAQLAQGDVADKQAQQQRREAWWAARLAGRADGGAA